MNAAPSTFTATRRIEVDLMSTESTAAATAWWEEITGIGGEGMVSKSSDNGRVGRKAQPGIRVRGRDYLRLTHGPAYTDAANLARLRNWSLGHKQSMTLREYALGMESLQ